MFLGFPRKAFVTKLTPTRKIANVGAVADLDVNRFVIAAGITNHTEQTALYQLVFSLKNLGLWAKIRALWPMVGGSAVSCSFNLKNTGLFQSTWINAPSFSSNGVLGNAVNQYGLTGFNPAVQLPVNNCGLGVYVRNSGSGIAFGVRASGGGGVFSITPQIAGNVVISNATASFAGATANIGFFFGSKTADNRVRTFHNGLFCQQSPTASATALPSAQVGILGEIQSASGTPNSALLSNQQVALAIITELLTDLEVQQLNSIVTQFQTILGRQV